MSSEKNEIKTPTVAIKLENINKSFQIYDKPHHRLMQSFFRGRKKIFREFNALKNISLEVKKGETVGIIGHNGAGKSTLLQIICGTLTQTSGTVETNGRVAALLELGAGFNPEFTGRENVFMNASLLGMSTETTESHLNEIINFADIGDVLDQPVKTYSSGMFMRLAFSVATCVDPDILIVDEALSVGDAKFQSKCFRRFDEMIAGGATILFVSHSTDQIVRHCDRAILLSEGQVHADGVPKDVTNLYLDMLFGVKDKNSNSGSEGEIEAINSDLEKNILMKHLNGNFESRPGYNSHEYRWGSKEAIICDFFFTRDGEERVTSLEIADKFSISILVKYMKDVDIPIYGFQIKTPDGVVIYGLNSRDSKLPVNTTQKRTGEYEIVTFECDQKLAPGDYLISVGLAEQVRDDVIPLDRRFDSILLTVIGRADFFGLVDCQSSIKIQ